ncbi:hypothetical protein F5Y09DRAFT_245710 [Xylaria sp. FL1042]|nr:hypothetical protein F5Y09DRAFT_245710 [Xylaria sp. FL1042]
MGWLTRRSSTPTNNRDSRGSLTRSSQTPSSQRHQGTGTLQVPPHAHPQDLRSAMSPGQGGSKGQQPTLRMASLRDITAANVPKHYITSDDTKWEAAHDDRNCKGTKRAQESSAYDKKADPEVHEASKSIWERKAAKVGGHDGDGSHLTPERKLLPAWLREQ